MSIYQIETWLDKCILVWAIIADTNSVGFGQTGNTAHGRTYTTCIHRAHGQFQMAHLTVTPVRSHTNSQMTRAIAENASRQFAGKCSNKRGKSIKTWWQISGKPISYFIFFQWNINLRKLSINLQVQRIALQSL